MTLSEQFSNLLKYLNSDNLLDRATFGLDINKESFWYKLLTWRATDVVLIAVLYFIYIVTYDLAPFERQFYVNDLTISHPFAEHERVDGTQLMLYAVWIPLAIIVAAGLVFTKPKNKVYVTYVAVVGLGVSTFTTSVLTDLLKNYIGRHRPDFLSRCVPKPDTPKDVLVFAKDVCTTKNLELLRDGFRTTPSGHSSLSFSGLLYLSLFLAGQLVVTNKYVGAWRTVLCALPTVGAALIALSRTEDYRHHFVDILIGSTIGIIIAIWTYFRLFPSLSHRKPYEPILLQKEDEGEGYNIINEQV
ncbi:acid phosphatase/Vanadium-dependent haloperoxidase [Suhomyces tanzawaensis NRRL Y-17324]|uniref:Acid phosphatase/Vanadium-dependent haloperoxidase n=1 Tax=Suhomyces tanzawaensis NRRL Y-17324 TaxID=984487 RepID=A0A1E4SRD7_9ASCO|nr:acid phosphatase/Vanadium-dependent haloperoxidase [Suhomyces tanzawaensis NRRL Y-17324]ODV82076.1 acid phosphatase/Vanadium-dependent haloperoxidase [Suhomyces tanzawaensis NRRL Y-17324]